MCACGTFTPKRVEEQLLEHPWGPRVQRRIARCRGVAGGVVGEGGSGPKWFVETEQSIGVGRLLLLIPM